MISSRAEGEEVVHYDFHGYLKDMFVVSDGGDFYQSLGQTLGVDIYSRGWLQDNYSRVRLKGRLGYRNLLQFSVDYEVLAAVGDTRKVIWRARDFSAEETMLVSGVMPGGNPENVLWDLEKILSEGEGYRIYHRIDRLSLAAYFPYFDLVIGRQALSWGSGMVWRPTDLFSPFAPTEIDTEEKPGTDAINAEARLGSLSSIQLVWAPGLDSERDELELDSSRIGGRFLTNFKELDLALMSGYFRGNWVVGGDLARPIGGAVLRGEGLVSIGGDEAGTWFQGVINADYAFPHNVYLIGEYYFNGFGSPDADEYGSMILDLGGEWQTRALRGEIFNLGEHELALLLNWEAHPLVHLSQAVICNPADGSFILSPQAEWSALKNLVFLAGVYLFLGPDESEYGGFSVPGWEASFQPPNHYFLYGKFYF